MIKTDSRHFGQESMKCRESVLTGVVVLPLTVGQDFMEKSVYACYNVYAEEVDSSRVFFGEAVHMIEENIRNLFLEYPEVIYGFTDIAYSAYAGIYKSALVFAVPHGEQLTIETYSEERFEKGLQDAKKTVEKILTQLKTVLDEQEIKYHIPPLAQNNETDLTAPFSFKFAAVNAGLGWIGKNDVVITEKYGPRVRLSAILINEQFACGDRILNSHCPESCRKCVDACPYKALHDVQWNIRSLRSEIIDYRLCNEKRSLYIKAHGRKNACGLCMAACPFGT